MAKLSEYVEMAATEYVRETGSTELDAVWVARFFAESGVQDEYPLEDLVAFAAQVQKSLNRKSEKARKEAERQVLRLVEAGRRRRWRR